MIQILPLRTGGDESAVSALFKSQSMKFAGLELIYDRGQDFKKLLSLQSNRFQTYLAKDDNNLRSLISISSGPRWFENQIRNIAFVSDFRIDKSRKSRTSWRQLLDQVVELFDQEFPADKPDYFFATILKGNKDALRSFIPSRRSNEFQMKEVASVRMVNIFARWRSVSKATDLIVSNCQTPDHDELLNFISKAEQQRQLGYVFNAEKYSEWKLRQELWKTNWSDFLILRKNGRIVGCTLPWAADPSVKSMKFVKAPVVLEWMLRGLHQLGFKVPLRNEPIKTLYLTHLNLSDDVEKDGAIGSFLDFVYNQKLNAEYQMVSFPDWWGIPRDSAILKRTLNQTIEVGIYSISVGGRKLVDPTPDRNFNFEMAVI